MQLQNDSNREISTGIIIRSIIFSWEKINFVIQKAEEHNLHIFRIEWGGGRWPRVHVKGKNEDIGKFFDELKEKFFLTPSYLQNNN